MSNITIKDASGEIRSENWPPQTEPKMLNDARDEKAQAAEDAYQAFKTNNGRLKSTSILTHYFDGSYRVKDNNSGETRYMNADGTERS